MAKSQKETSKNGDQSEIEDHIELADLITKVRESIDRAAKHRKKAGLKPLLAVHEAKVQAQVQIVNDKQGGGGIKIWVADLSAKAAKKVGATHTISITLRPSGSNAEDDDFMAGAEVHKR